MNIFQNEHLEILKILKKNSVNFLLIGGVAVNYYGFNRPTGDLDVWLEPSDQNKQMLVKALYELKIFEDDIRKIEGCNFSDSLVFHIGTKPPFVIDFLTKIVGVKWEEAWSMKDETVFEGMEIAFIHINHLKINKMLAGRPKDLEDINQLNRIEELRKKH